MNKAIYFAFAFAICILGISCAKHPSADDESQKTNIYNLVILDCSGSMQPLREAAIQGYNETLEVIRVAQEQYGIEQQNFVSLVLFNFDIKKVFDCDTVQNMPNLLTENYLPEGPTAMWDAIGISLSDLQQNMDSLDNATAVVTIISDGLENASHRFSLAQVVSQIDSLKDQGVMFVFMGTNQNVTQTAAQLHIDTYRIFEYTEDGMRDAWESGIKASAEYYNRMAQYNKDTRGMSKEERNAYFRDRNKENGWFE